MWLQYHQNTNYLSCEGLFPDMASTWLAAFFTEVMLFPRMWILLLLPSRPREASSCWLVSYRIQGWYQLPATNSYSWRWSCQGTESCVHVVQHYSYCWGMGPGLIISLIWCTNLLKQKTSLKVIVINHRSFAALSAHPSSLVYFHEPDKRNKKEGLNYNPPPPVCCQCYWTPLLIILITQIYLGIPGFYLD